MPISGKRDFFPLNLRSTMFPDCQINSWPRVVGTSKGRCFRCKYSQNVNHGWLKFLREVVTDWIPCSMVHFSHLYHITRRISLLSIPKAFVQFQVTSESANKYGTSQLLILIEFVAHFHLFRNTEEQLLVSQLFRNSFLMFPSQLFCMTFPY